MGFRREVGTPPAALRLGNTKKHVLEVNWMVLGGYLLSQRPHRGYKYGMTSLFLDSSRTIENDTSSEEIAIPTPKYTPTMHYGIVFYIALYYVCGTYGIEDGIDSIFTIFCQFRFFLVILLGS